MWGRPISDLSRHALSLAGHGGEAFRKARREPLVVLELRKLEQMAAEGGHDARARLLRAIDAAERTDAEHVLREREPAVQELALDAIERIERRAVQHHCLHG